MKGVNFLSLEIHPLLLMSFTLSYTAHIAHSLRRDSSMAWILLAHTTISVLAESVPSGTKNISYVYGESKKAVDGNVHMDRQDWISMETTVQSLRESPTTLTSSQSIQPLHTQGRSLCSHQETSPNVSNKHVVTEASDVTSSLLPVADHVRVLGVEMRSCLQRNASMTFSAYKLSFEVDEPASDDVNTKSLMTCAVTLSTFPDLTVVSELWRMSSHKCSHENYITIWEETKTMTWYYTCPGHPVTHFRGSGHRVTYHVIMGDTRYYQGFTINVHSTATKLQAVRISPTQGYIQTWDHDLGKDYSAMMDTWVDVFPPQDHVTMMSMRKLNIQQYGNGNCPDFLELYADGKTSADRVWRLCGISPPPPFILHAREMHVRFHSDGFLHLSGFRLFYSHHLPSRAPSRVSGGLWNCSVPEWCEFNSHFDCNLLTECEAGQDELPCFYSGFCGQGYITLHNRCYQYQRPNKSLSWVEANMACGARGGYLASLNTPQEWELVYKVLWVRPSTFPVFIGLKIADSSFSYFYKYSWQWADGSIAQYMKAEGTTGKSCGSFTKDLGDRINMNHACSRDRESHYLCEMDSQQDGNAGIQYPGIKSVNGSGIQSLNPKLNGRPTVRFFNTTSAEFQVPVVECPEKHFTHVFLACDVESACWQSRSGFAESEIWGVPTVTSCPAPLTSLPAMFTCGSGVQRVPYSLVCDHATHCGDESDESFCEFPSCSSDTSLRCVLSSQCIASQQLCDYQHDCSDKTDEFHCNEGVYHVEIDHLPPPAIVHFDKTGGLASTDILRVDPPPAVQPETHFQCSRTGYYLPVFMRCNQVVDCPGREDEEACEEVRCPGYYRCRGSAMCVHSTSLCDDVFHCPQKDDEMVCDVTCPPTCTCHRRTFTCPRPFSASSYLDLRYLNAEGSAMTPDDLVRNVLLVHLSLKNCSLQFLHNLTLENLRSLDLSDNLLTVLGVGQLEGVSNLQVLSVRNNPLTTPFPHRTDLRWTLPTLRRLDLSGVALEEMDFSELAPFPNLLTVNLSQSSLKTVYSNKSHTATKIAVLDLRGCPLTQVEDKVIARLSDLQLLFADDYKLCCPVVLPAGFNFKKCLAPTDVVSSCDSLLGFTVLRVCVVGACCGVVIANLFGLVVHFIDRQSGESSGKDAFVTHLCVSDLVMSMCAVVLAVADAIFDGSYVLEDATWRHSWACFLIHLLSLLSSQASLCFLFLLICDRLLLVLSSSHRLLSTPVWGHLVCLMVWVACVVMSLLLVLLWSQHSPAPSALCLRLPVTSAQDLPAHVHAWRALTIFNLLLLLSSTAVHITVCIKVHNVSPMFSTVTANQAISEAVSACGQVSLLCAVSLISWGALSLHALLTWHRTSTSQENVLTSDMTSEEVTMTLMAGPVLAAVRPCVYGVGVMQEVRRRERMKRLLAYCHSTARLNKQTASTRASKQRASTQASK